MRRNKGILEAYEKGIVTSTSVMVNEIAADEAKYLAMLSNISVGLHFVTTGTENIRHELDKQIEL